MKKIFFRLYFFSLLFITASCSAEYTGTENKTPIAEYAANQIIVKLHKDADLSVLDSLNTIYKVSTVKPLFPQSLSLEERIELFEKKAASAHSAEEKGRFESELTRLRKMLARRDKNPDSNVDQGLKNIYLLEAAPGADVMQMVRDYSKLPGVVYAEPNRVMTINAGVEN